MKKAVITISGKQYLVTEGEVLEVNKLADSKKLSLEPLLVIDGETVKVGKPGVSGASVGVEVVDQEILGDKVVAIRYKPKKRVKKIRGHRQRLSRIKVTKITS